MWRRCRFRRTRRTSTARYDCPQLGPQPVLLGASCLRHKPLYFEDVNLERHGHRVPVYPARPWACSPFFASVPTPPYLYCSYLPRQCQYVLGHGRPGLVSRIRSALSPGNWACAGSNSRRNRTHLRAAVGMRPARRGQPFSMKSTERRVCHTLRREVRRGGVAQQKNGSRHGLRLRIRWDFSACRIEQRHFRGVSLAEGLRSE